MFFSAVADNRKCWNLALELTPIIVSSC